jgi:outer membrane biosynthesis protein TonB
MIELRQAKFCFLGPSFSQIRLWSAAYPLSAYVFVFPFVVLLMATRFAAAQDRDHAKISERNLRQMEKTHIVPVAPRSLGRHGLNVFQLYISRNGTVENIVALQTTSPEAEHAIVTTIKNWRFDQELSDGKPIGVVGRITFYFINLNGRDVFIDPFSQPFVCNPAFTSCTV